VDLPSEYHCERRFNEALSWRYGHIEQIAQAESDLGLKRAACRKKSTVFEGEVHQKVHQISGEKNAVSVTH